MTGSDVWNVMRWLIGLYLIGVGAYALMSRRVPRTSRPHSSWPFAAGPEYRGRHAQIIGVIFAAAGIALLILGGS